ncbi:peptide chain release factor 1 [Achromatium sp. WMS2]|nr:peptide chain release factor 1 [Achromatium sp. WMS2]
MTPSIRTKLQRIVERQEDITALLADPTIQNNSVKLKELGQELSQIQPIADCYRQYCILEQNIKNTQDILDDPELSELARSEIAEIQQQQRLLEPELERLLVPPDPDDKRNIYLEIRAGTGGAEAALFAGDLHRAYLRYAETQGWQVELLTESLGEHGGYKEIISRIIGQGVYARLKFESGTHRVQRVPLTEAQGRVHTSACTVAILPEVEDIETIDINPAELRVDTFRASGAGGQHINKTDSAIRITHLPSGIVVECQNERSQHKNRSQAMSLLRTRLLNKARTEQTDAQAKDRKQQVGSGDRSERIRTYNFPQNRLTDHRINLTLYQLDAIMQGQMDLVIDPLIKDYEVQQLANLAQQDG